MTERANSVDDSGSLNSILKKREAAASAVPIGNVNTPGNPSSVSTSTGSFQLVTDERVGFSRDQSATVSGPKGESFSGGGVLQVRGMLILVLFL